MKLSQNDLDLVASRIRSRLPRNVDVKVTSSRSFDRAATVLEARILIGGVKNQLLCNRMEISDEELIRSINPASMLATKFEEFAERTAHHVLLARSDMERRFNELVPWREWADADFGFRRAAQPVDGVWLGDPPAAPKPEPQTAMPEGWGDFS